MSILNSNCYQRGAQDGINDAKAERDKDYSRAGLSVEFALYGEKALDTYIEGYNKGYDSVILRRAFEDD